MFDKNDPQIDLSKQEDVTRLKHKSSHDPQQHDGAVNAAEISSSQSA